MKSSNVNIEMEIAKVCYEAKTSCASTTLAYHCFSTSYLIDPDGKIVLKEVGYKPYRPSAMGKRMAGIFDGSREVMEEKQSMFKA